MACNMRCKHCGSSCTDALPGELTTLEAFKFIDMCKDIGLKWISLSGGEPFVRPDLLLLMKYLERNDIPANILTNGWLITEPMVKELSNIRNIRVSISLDGPKNVHDRMRREGSFEKAIESYKLLKKYGMQTGCTTTLTKENLGNLDELYETLVNLNIDIWQFQLGLPMGNLEKNKNLLIEPSDLLKFIDFFHEKALEKKIRIYPADCIGYYSQKVDDMLKLAYGVENAPVWSGCNAGKHSFGLLHNGDVVGCTSIRDKKYVEGNIKERTLREIWEDPNSFSWNRKFNAKNLKGDCHNCEYAKRCLGGCANTRLTTNGTFDSENLYCTHNLFLKKERQEEKSKKSLEDKELPKVSGGFGGIGVNIDAYGMVEPDREEIVSNDYGNVMPYPEKSINVEQKIDMWANIENSNNNFNFNPHFKK